MPKQTIHEYLDLPAHWPVVENVKHEVILMPNKADIKGAKRQDPQACALHNAACRVYGIPNCAIGGVFAYIPQRGPKGQYYIAKMQPSVETKRAIRAFDVTGKIPEGGFRFVPLSASQFRKHVNRYKREREANLRAEGRDPREPGSKKKPSKRKTLRAMPRSMDIS